MGKIIKNGIDYGGGVAVDSTLDATSMNAVANKPVAEAITQLNRNSSQKNDTNGGGVWGRIGNDCKVHAIAGVQKITYYYE